MTSQEAINEEAAIKDYQEACELLTQELISAIGLSFTHGTLFHVEIDQSCRVTLDDAYEILSNVVDEFDHFAEPDGSEYVCGKFDGDSFELNLYLN